MADTLPPPILPETSIPVAAMIDEPSRDSGDPGPMPLGGGFLPMTDEIPIIPSDDPAVQVIVPKPRIRRPELISVSFCKPTPDFPVGVTILGKRKKLYICKIPDSSLLIEAPISVDDELLGINGVDCRGKTPIEAARIIREAVDCVTLVVRNPEAEIDDVSWIHIIKPHPNALVGISLEGSNGEVRVQDLDDNGLACFSLLSLGDRILRINDADCDDKFMCYQQANVLIETSEGSVQIVTAKKQFYVEFSS